MDDRRERPLVLTGGRVVIALLLAAGLGAGFTVLCVVAWYLASPEDVNGPARWSEFVSIYSPAFLVWLIGLALLGGPVWSLLHHRGLRNWPVAMAAGFAVPFVVMLAIGTQMFTGQMTASGWLIAFQSSAILGGIGAVLGLVIWHTAYRRG